MPHQPTSLLIQYLTSPISHLCNTSPLPYLTIPNTHLTNTPPLKYPIFQIFRLSNFSPLQRLTTPLPHLSNTTLPILHFYNNPPPHYLTYPIPHLSIICLIMRPIIDQINTRYYNVVEVLASYLQPLAENKYTLSNTQFFPKILTSRPDLQTRKLSATMLNRFSQICPLTKPLIHL